MTGLQIFTSLLKRTSHTLPGYISHDVECVVNKEARSIFEKIINKTVRKGGKDFESSINYVDDILQKYNMCEDNTVKQKVIGLLSSKKHTNHKTLREAEKLLDSINEQNGLYTPLSKFCYSKEELPEVQKEIEKFYKEVFCSQTKPQRKSGLKLPNELELGAGTYDFANNKTFLKSSILTDPFMFKAVDKKTGKVLEEIDNVNQMAGYTRDIILEQAKKAGANDYKLLLMNREERLKLLKAFLAHENFHAIQFNNIMLHPEIGLRKLNRAYVKYSSDNIFKKLFYSVVSFGKNIGFVLKNEKLRPGTEVYTQTIEQFNTWTVLMQEHRKFDKLIKRYECIKKRKPASDKLDNILDKLVEQFEKFIESYNNSATELGAYNKQRLFSIKNDLLI